MSAHDNGGPAFPVATVFNPHTGEPTNTGCHWDGNGMSLRDWFAGMALQGFCSQTNNGGEWTWGKTDAPKAAYELADAMLAEREKGQR